MSPPTQCRFASQPVLRACALLFLLATATPCQIGVDSWTTENGLPQNIINGICQTPDGYIWLATFDGLVRFDGVRFTTYDRSNTPGIDGNRFGSMFCTADGDIWLGAEGSGVTLNRRGQFTTYTIRDGLRSDSIDGVTGDEQGNIWALAKGVVHRWHASERRFSAIEGPEYQFEGYSIQDGGTRFGRVADRTLHLFSRGRELNYPLPPDWPRDTRMLTALRVSEFNQELWFTSTAGAVARFVDGRWSPVVRGLTGTSAHPGKIGFVSHYRDSQGNPWKFDVLWDGYRLVFYLEMPPGARPAGYTVRTLFTDRDGNTWICTEGEGLLRLRQKHVRVISKEEGLPDRNVYPLYEGRDGAMWIGTWSGGLCRFENEKPRCYTTADGLASNRIFALFEDREGRLWVSAEGGFRILRDGRFQTPRAQPGATGFGFVTSIYQDQRGRMWFGRIDGLLKFEQDRWSLLTKKDGLAGDDVRVVIEGRGGALWVAGYGGLSRIANGRVQAWTERDGLASNMVRALYEDSQGVLWIGTYDGGLGRLENGKFTKITVADGLYNNGVFQILEDSQANLWMSCNRGIYRVGKQQLNEFAAGTIRTVTSVPYGKRDGMNNAECNGGLWPAGVRARDGRLWFPTQDGAAVIDPGKVTMNSKPPPVVIESCLIDREPASIGSPVRVLPADETIEIQYTALSFIDSEHIRFRYRLEGLERDWIDAGARRTAYYSHIPPGNYTFRVTAAHSDGTWNETEAALALTVLPPFYRTWWFTALLSLMAIVCLWLAVSYRLRRVERARAAQQAFSRGLIALQEEERKRIAGELHDSLGQRLVVISNLAILSRRHSNGDKDLQQQIDDISSESSQAIHEVREICYNLRPYQLDRLGLRRAILALVRTTSGATAARIEAEVDEIDGFFPKESEINFYRIVQECLNNVIKHSEATEVRLGIERRENSLSLSVRDNGKGFVTGLAASDPMRGGFGLVGIRERAELLGGKASVWTAPGEGTMVRILIGREALGSGR